MSDLSQHKSDSLSLKKEVLSKEEKNKIEQQRVQKEIDVVLQKVL